MENYIMDKIQLMKNYMTNDIQIIAIYIIMVIIIIWIIMVIKKAIFKPTKIDKKIINEFKSGNSKYVMELLDKLITDKYEYYLYKEILPVYIGNISNKKEKFSKEKFLQLKENFFSDINMSLSKNIKSELINLFTREGIEIYIHQKFATLFNKTDAKFLNGDTDIKENMFFMSDKMQTKGK